VIYGLKANDGSIRWKTPTGKKITGAVAVGSDGTGYVGNYAGLLTAFNVTDGGLKWQNNIGSQLRASPAIGLDNNLYIGTWDGRFVAVGTGTGSNELNGTAYTYAIPYFQENGDAAYTSVTLMNPHDSIMKAYSLEAYSSSGSLLGRITGSLAPHSKIEGLARDLFQLTSSQSGYILAVATQPAVVEASYAFQATSGEDDYFYQTQCALNRGLLSPDAVVESYYNLASFSATLDVINLGVNATTASVEMVTPDGGTVFSTTLSSIGVGGVGSVSIPLGSQGMPAIHVSGQNESDRLVAVLRQTDGRTNGRFTVQSASSRASNSCAFVGVGGSTTFMGIGNWAAETAQGVSLRLYDATGLLKGPLARNLAERASWSGLAGDLFSYPGASNSSICLDAGRPVGTTAVRQLTRPSDGAAAYAQHAPFYGSSLAWNVCLPLYRADSVWRSTLVVTNLSDTAASLSLVAYDGSGASRYSTGLGVLAPRSSLSLNVGNWEGRSLVVSGTAPLGASIQMTRQDGKGITLIDGMNF